MQQNQFYNLSQKFIQAGLSIIPVEGKRPLITEWQRYCSELMDEPIMHPKQTGIGLCLGPASNLIAIDIDTDDKKILDLIPPSPIVRRGKKGEVRFYQFKKGVESRTYHTSKVEILSTGRQVVLPPSIHPETGKPYVWVSQDLLTFNLSLLPEISLEFISKLPNDKQIFDNTNKTGRNNKLKEIAASMFFRGYSPQEVGSEIYKVDKETHNPRLFTDPLEYRNIESEEDAKHHALTFAASVYQSMVRNRSVSLDLVSIDDSPLFEPVVVDHKELKYPVPQGIMGEIVELIDEASYTKVTAFSIAAAIPIFATMVGHAFRFGDVFANTFSLIIGSSGSGKKFGIQTAKKLFADSGLDCLYSADYSSAPAISNDLTDYCVHLAMNEEFSKILKLAASSSAWQSAIPQDLCQLWSASEEGFLLPRRRSDTVAAVTKKKDEEKEVNKSQKQIVEKPYVSILAATTDDEFKTNSRGPAFSSGMLPRFLMFVSSEQPKPVNFIDSVKVSELLKKIKTKYIEKFIEQQKDVLRRSTNTYTDVVTLNPFEVKVHPDYQDTFLAFMDGFSEMSIAEEHQVKKAVKNRFREHFKKLCLLHCLSREDYEIKTPDMLWADETLRVMMNNLAPVISEAAADSSYETNMIKVFNKILKAGSKGLTLREICRGLFNSTQKVIRDTIIKDLIERGLVIEDKKSTLGEKGRPTTRYIAIKTSIDL